MTSCFKRCLALVVGLSALMTWSTGFSHQFAPALLELTEQDQETVAVYWKQPLAKVTGSQLQPILPGDCEGMGSSEVEQVGTGVVTRWQVRCAGGLRNKTIRVEGIPESRADVLLRVEFAEGRSLNHVLTGDRPAFTIPEEENWYSIFLSYCQLGIEHILSGYDHLLFVLGLTLLAVGRLKLFWTITAFTLGHSITLGLAVLGFVILPSGPVEIAIAVSIFLLAWELARPPTRTLLRTYTWPLAVLFGLLHGLGFAGALTEIGLPQQDIALALFAFNVGIELGQIAFVIIVLLVWAVLRLLPFRYPRPLQLAPAYVIGAMSVFWILERGQGVFPELGLF